jgi:hypothetical protein
MSPPASTDQPECNNATTQHKENRAERGVGCVLKNNNNNQQQHAKTKASESNDGWKMIMCAKLQNDKQVKICLIPNLLL